MSQQARPRIPMPAGHSFPILKIDEIIQACASAGLPIDAGDIHQPTPARVQFIYEWWLQTILHISIEDCKKAAEEQLDHMENPDIYREAMYIGVFHLTLNQLLLRASIDDFAPSDLTAPTTLRVVVILSGIINFNLFERELAAKHLAPIEQEDDGNEAREEALIASNQELKAKIDQERESRRANEPRVKSLEQQFQEHMKVMMKYQEVHRVVMKDLKDLAESVKDVVKQIEELSSTITVQERDINRLKGQIVSSPDRLRATISDMQRSVQQDKESVISLEHKERQLQAKIASLQKYEVDLSSCLKIMDEWEIDVGKLNEATKRYQQHCDIYEALVAEKTELDNNITLLKRRVKNAREELARFEAKTVQKRAASKQRKKSLEEHYAQLMEQKRMLDLQAVAKNREAAEVENQIREIHASLHKEIDRGAMGYKLIKDQYSLYSNRINKALDSINAINMQTVDYS